MTEPTAEQLNEIFKNTSSDEFVNLHNNIDLLCQADEYINRLVSSIARSHGFDFKSMTGNGLTIGITVGMFLAAQIQADKAACKA